MGLLDGNGQELATRLAGEAEAVSGTRVLLADAAENRFEFVDVASPPVPSLFRDFSAPVKLSGVSPERLRFLAAHDTDPFVCWDSGQQYAASVLLDMVATIQQGGAPSVDPALIEAAASALSQEPAFAAEALVLPGEAFLADKMTVVDVDAIHSARDQARTAIGQALADRLRATYDRLTDTGPYRIDGGSIGARSLRNTCLAYLVASGDPAAVGLAKAQFDAGLNAGAKRCPGGILCGVAGRSAGAGQVVLDPGVFDIARHDRGGSGVDVASGFRSAEPEPGAGSGGCVRRESGAVP
jgi:aminopeptidase N